MPDAVPRGSGHFGIVGTPAAVADTMEEWFATGAADGFVIQLPYLSGAVEDFARSVIPELQRRGLFRIEYEASTLRGNLGMTPVAAWKDFSALKACGFQRYDPEPGRYAAGPRARDRHEPNAAWWRDLRRERSGDVLKLWIGEETFRRRRSSSQRRTRRCKPDPRAIPTPLGLPALRDALSAYHKRHWDVDVPASRFAITAGGMNAIMQASQALMDPGDEIIIPSPSWTNLTQAVKIIGGVPISVAFRGGADGRYSLRLQDILDAVTERTKIIVINSPSNPTGWVMPPSEMKALRDAARARGLWILSDEVYSHFVYGNAPASSFLQICTDEDRLIVTNTFSKNWAMTGWRAGWLIYPTGMDSVFARLGQYNTTSIPTFIQHAAVAALNGGMTSSAHHGRALQ